MKIAYRTQALQLRSLPRINYHQGKINTILNAARIMAEGELNFRIRLANTSKFEFIDEFETAQSLTFDLGRSSMPHLGTVRAIVNELRELFCEGLIKPDRICDLKRAYDLAENVAAGQIRQIVLACIKDPQVKSIPPSPIHPIQTGLLVEQTTKLDNLLDQAEQFEEDGKHEAAARRYETAAKEAFRHGFQPEAYSLWQKALHNRKFEGKPARIAFCLEETGKVALDLSRYDDALSYWQEALVIREENGRARSIAYALEEIAKIYEILENKEDALSYWQLALEQYQRSHSRNNIRFARMCIEHLEGALKEPSDS